MLSEISRLQKTIYLTEVPRRGQFIGTDSRRVVARGWGRGEWGASVQWAQNFRFASEDGWWGWLPHNVST